LTLNYPKVTYKFGCHKTARLFTYNTKKGRTLMGAILDVTEMLKEPAGMITALVVIAAGYFFVKWVFAEPEEGEE
jgi:hypothetical protein